MPTRFYSPLRYFLALGLVGTIGVSTGSSGFAQTSRTWTGAVSTDWFSAGNWSPAGVPATNDTVNFASGTINLTNAVTIYGHLNWSGGTVSGAGLTIATGGVLTLNGSGSTSLATSLTNAGTVNWTGGTFYLYNCSTNAGPIVNLPGAVWNIQTDSALSTYCALGSNSYFQNAGTLTKLGGTGNTPISVPINNTGLISAQAGTISLQGGGTIDGTFNAAAGATITFNGGDFTTGPTPVLSGAGLIQLTGGNLLMLYNDVPNLQLYGGTISLGAGFEGGSITNLNLAGSTLVGTNTVSGVMNWTAGSLGGPLTVAPSGVLTLGGSGAMFLDSALTNAGKVIWEGGTLYFYNCSYNAGPVVNLAGGTWDIQCDRSMASYCSLGSNTYFQNAGTVTKTVGTGSTAISIPVENTGLISVQVGTISLQDGGVIDGTNSAAEGVTLSFAGGNFVTGPSPSVSGAGLVQFSAGNLLMSYGAISNLQLTGGTVALSPDFEGGTITNLTLDGSTLAGTNTVSGIMNWTSGSLGGPLTVAPGGVLTLSGDGSRFLDSSLTNAGTVNWAGGTLYFYNCSYNAGPVVNLPGGVWNIQCDRSMASYCSLSTNTFFQNAGTMTKTAGTGSTSFSIPVTNTGSMSAQAGTISLQDGGVIDGALNAAAGAAISISAGSFSTGLAPTFSGVGTIQLSGGDLLLAYNWVPSLQLNSGAVSLGSGFQGGSITNLTLSGATLNGSNTVSGIFNWTSGAVAGSLMVAPSGNLNLVGYSTMYLEGALTNAGTVNWTGGNLYLYNCSYNAGPVVNLPGGLWNIQCDQSLSYNCSLASSSYFQNLGTIRKSSGSGTTYFSIPLNSQGSVVALQGTIYLNDGGILGGTYSAAGGATVNFGAGAFSYTTPPLIVGPGVVQMVGGTLTLSSDSIPGLQLAGGTVSLGTNFQGGVITNFTLNGSTLGGNYAVKGVFNLGSGTVSGDVAVLDGAVMNFMAGTVGGSLTVSSNGVLNLIGNSTMYVEGALTNAGTVNWTGGNFYLYDCSYNAGPVINLPGAFWNIKCDQSISYNCNLSTNSYFLNLGTMQKLSGSGTTYFSIPLNNLGSIAALQGTIYLNNGGMLGGSFSAAASANVTFGAGPFSFGTPPVLAGPGTIQLSGGTATLATNSVPGLQLTGGIVTLGSNFQGGVITNFTLGGSTLAGSHTVAGVFNMGAGTVAGDLTVADGAVMNFMGGTVSGALNVAGNGQLNLIGNSTMYVQNTLTNAGTVNWTGGNLYLYDCSYNAGPVVNLPGGLWTIKCDQSISYNCSLSTNSYFLNWGTIQKLSGSGTTYFSIPLSNQGSVAALQGTVYLNNGGTLGGTFTAAAGADVTFGAGPFSYSTPPLLAGPGAIQLTGGTLTLLNDSIPGLQLSGGTVTLGTNFQGGTITNLTLQGSTLTGTNTVTGTFIWNGGTVLGGLAVTGGGTLDWSGGTAVGPLSIASNAVLNLLGNSTMYLGSSLTNWGNVNWLGGNLNFNGCSYTPGPIVNASGAFWNIQCDQSISYNCSIGANSYFQNLGTVQKTGSTGTSYFYVPANNAGVLDVESGAVYFAANPGYTQTGATMDFGVGGPGGAPKVTIIGNVNFDGTLGVNLLNGYTPAIGDSITLVNYASEAGAFKNLSLAPLASGRAWQLAYNAASLALKVVANSNSVGQITGTVLDNLGQGVGNLAVFAYTTNNYYVSSRTDAGGNYALNVSNGVFQVGLQGLPARGYNAVTNQIVGVTNVTKVVNFVVQPYTGPLFAINIGVNPPGGGTAVGGGTFPPGSLVTVSATPSTNPLPYFFANWTENGVIQSTSNSYAFSALRDRLLQANFTLPVFTVSATNSPNNAGTVSGAGSYFYGDTSLLTAHPVFGYSFDHWSEGTNVLGTNLTLSTVIYSNHLFAANYSAANLVHIVTTASFPPGLVAVAGAGTYTNGQTGNFAAPAALTNVPYVYTFQGYSLSNTVVSTNVNFAKTFSTFDATNLQYVAVYGMRTILPLLTNITANFVNPVPATTNFVLRLQFDRSMATNIPVIVSLTNAGAALQAIMGAGGLWSKSANSNDTYSTPPITFVSGMDGTNQLWVSGAQDTVGSLLATTNPASFLVDATAPPAPVLSVVSSNAAGPVIVVGWPGYVAPADLAGFRVYLQTTNFSLASSVPVYTGLGSSARSYQFNGLALDTPYFVAIQSFDAVGNSLTSVLPLGFRLPSTVPSAVNLQQTPVGASSSLLSWNGYDTSGLFGFAGFRIYSAQTNFSSIAGLTPLATVGVSSRSYQVDGLDRTRPYYFAVVGFNGTNGSNPNVATALWSDPYAGTIGVNTTIGGASPTVLNFYQSIVVKSNATLTIQPGTTLLFAPGTGLIVQQGSLVANGTALAPIIFDSGNDTPGNTPAAADWNGVMLGAGAGFSVLRFVEIHYGGGLTISGCSPIIDAFTAAQNAPWGLGLQNGATLITSNALLTANNFGAVQSDTSLLTIQNSVILNNVSNALASGVSAMNAASVWWGNAEATNVTAGLAGNVAYSPFLTYEPLLTPAVGTSNGVTQVGSASVNLRLACRTAEAMRISEDFSFSGVFFSPFTNLASLALSPGGGLKRIYAQYRSTTGQTNAPLELDVNYLTGGPVIQSFSLSQGQTLNRPLKVTGTATAVLGMKDIEFYVDGILLGTNAGGSLSLYFDIRSLGNATHEVEILARDNSGNVASLKNQVVVALFPPPAPVIAQPAAGLILNSNTVTISGSAEPGIGLQVTRNGQVLTVLNADAAGLFAVTNALLAEGDNLLLAIASDSVGTTASAGRTVTVETMPPAALVLNPPLYTPGSGLNLNWALPLGGKPSVSYRLFWNGSSFATTNQASGHSIALSQMFYNLQGVADGTYYFGVVGYDTAGNASPLSALVSTVYDSTPPALSVSYTPAPPVGVAPLNIVLTASEALSTTPSLTLQPAGAYSPILLVLTNVALNTWQTGFPVTPATASGPVVVKASASDLAGNVFAGSPSGPQLVFDTTPPSGAIATVPSAPVQTTGGTNVSISLTLSEAAQPGSPPLLTFVPPQGASVPITLGGSGSNWSGTLALTSLMGSGFGQFTLSVLDVVGNLGTNISSGRRLELYNTALPTPPAAPLGLSVVSQPGGSNKLSWLVSSNAQFYHLYREPGTNLTAPAVLVADAITNSSFVDLPPADGPYRYGVTATRLGSESGMSNVVVGISDRTPPPAPANVVASLASSGVQISWQEPSGEVPDHYKIYRNGVLINSTGSVTPVVDYPPKGTNSYVVSAVDAAGNENPGSPAVLKLLVGPVNQLAAVAVAGQPVLLSWTSTDPSAVGFNIYRNGIKQNASLLSTNQYADPLALSDMAQYAVTAVNLGGQESPSRLVSVYPLGLGLWVNAGGAGSSQPVQADYFDQYLAAITNLSSTNVLPLAQVQLTRTIAGLSPMTVTKVSGLSVAAGDQLQQSFVVREPSILATQMVQLTVTQQTDSQGSQVTYQQQFSFAPTQTKVAEIDISANQLPLAGGLTAFQVQVHNPSSVDIEFIVSRGSGATPGDFYISVLNGLGQEVSRTPFQGTPPGTFFLPDGRAYVTVKSGATLNFTVPNVLTPAALGGSTNVTFRAVASIIYSQLNTPNEVASGPLTGNMISSGLAQPPYYGTAQTDKASYANDDSIVISGQSLNTATGLPVPNAPLNIGFSARGYKWYVHVTTDAGGNYQLTYPPASGFAGLMTIWAAHPLVVDQLNQAPVSIYRLYSSPAGANITTSKNDTFNFQIQLINPGDLPLTGFTLGVRAYQMSGTNQSPVTTVTGTNVVPAGFVLAPNQKQYIGLQLSAAINAPDSLIVEYTITSAEGASLVFPCNVTLLPAVPVLSVVNPPSGYLEVSVNRGDQRSGQVTVRNAGLRDLLGVTLTPPTNAWMQVNLPISPDGLFHLPDLVIGQSNTFTVVFSPPSETPLAFYSDAITIQGTNTATSFAVNLYALVTSHSTGGVQFYVDDILGQAVPNAAVRLHSDVLFTEPPPFYTDTNGLVTITNLQEGSWNWQVSASGCSANIGTVAIVADQTIYQHTRLSRSLVTVTFNVVPVPFTDKYEIQVEQTFETHVPAPVIVLDPPFMNFNQVSSGFQANYTVNVKNYGLIQLSDVTLTGSRNGALRLTPLITYFPVLLPMQSVDVPFTLTYDTGSSSSGPQSQQDSGGCGPLGAAAKLIGMYLCEEDGAPTQGGATEGATVSATGCGDSGGSSAQDATDTVIVCIGTGGGGGGSSGPEGPSTGSGFSAGHICLGPDTQVLMADESLKRIADIRTNELVRTGTHSWNVATVVRTFENEAQKENVIRFVGASFPQGREVVATPEHLFWVDGKGWVSARNVIIGDWLFGPEGERLRVIDNAATSANLKTYTLELLGDRAFYANGVLVRDLCGKTPGQFQAVKAEVAQ